MDLSLLFMSSLVLCEMLHDSAKFTMLAVSVFKALRTFLALNVQKFKLNYTLIMYLI